MKQPQRLKPVTEPEIATPERPLFEPRLWGTWKSDRKKTFERVLMSKKTTQQQRKFRSMFGTLVVTWTKKRVSNYFDCDRLVGGTPNDRVPEVQNYVVVARSPGSAVICLCERARRRRSKSERETYELLSELDKDRSLVTIEFDGDDGYRVSLGSFFEYFRRVK